MILARAGLFEELEAASDAVGGPDDQVFELWSADATGAGTRDEQATGHY